MVEFTTECEGAIVGCYGSPRRKWSLECLGLQISSYNAITCVSCLGIAALLGKRFLFSRLAVACHLQLGIGSPTIFTAVEVLSDVVQ